MGDFKVHHVRFYEHELKAVHCMAVNSKKNKLALSRSDGSIEIWNIAENWVQEKVLLCGGDRSVEALVWCGDRLFSAGLHGYVKEHDLATNTTKCTVSADMGAIWCLVPNSKQTLLAAGTEEGCVILFDVSGDGIEFSRSLDRQEGRMLCLAWHEPEKVIVTGGIDNLRIWSLKSGHALQRLLPGKADVHRETVVWAVAITQDFTIVSGDSRGKVVFWNGAQGTQIKCFDVSPADVLCLCLCPDGSVCVSGVEPILHQFEFLAVQANSDWRRWVQTKRLYGHTHDVRALVATDSAIVSAGVDSNIVMHPIRTNVKRITSIPFFPQQEFACLASAPRLLLLQCPEALHVWKLGCTDSPLGADGEMLALRDDCQKLLELRTRTDEHVLCSALSPCGRWLAYSDLTKLRVYAFSHDVVGGVPAVQLTRITGVPAASVSHVVFPPGGSRLLYTSHTHLHVLSLAEDLPVLLKTLPLNTNQGVRLLRVSSDGGLLAVADNASRVEVIDLNTYETICTLPAHRAVPTALAFHPTQPVLAVCYSDRMIVEFDLKEKGFTSWSRRFLACMKHNSSWKWRHHKLLQVFYNPANTEQLFLRDLGALYLIDKKEPMPGEKEDIFQSQGHCIHVCSKYEYLVGLNALENGELVVVECTQAAVEKSLPPVFKKKMFGT